MPFDRLFDILKKARSRYPVLSQRIEEAEALTRWETAVGPIIAKHTRAIRVQESVLWVEVGHPIWKSELHHRKRQILDLLNGALPATRGKPALPPAKQILVDILFLDPRGSARNDPREPARNDPREPARNDPREPARNDPRKDASAPEARTAPAATTRPAAPSTPAPRPDKPPRS